MTDHQTEDPEFSDFIGVNVDKTGKPHNETYDFSPPLNLPNRYLSRARILSSRLDILPHLPKNAVYCEVGVAWGDFSAQILDICRPNTFIAIDLFDLERYPSMWGFERLQGTTHEDYYRHRFSKELASGRMRLVRDDSVDALEQLPDNSVDVFYIDAWHSYEAVSAELRVVKRKIKPDGWLILNDYTLYDVVSGLRYGVIQATHEFMLQEGWYIKFLALQELTFYDVALRKMPTRPKKVVISKTETPSVKKSARHSVRLTKPKQQ
jgi:hypothetical protein